MIITDENKEIIINSGAFGYDAEVMSSLLQVDIDVIKQQFDNKTEFKKLYEFGKNMAKYKLDLKLFEMAKNGDVKAIQQFETNKKSGF
jgi:hypothetical protein